MRCRTHREKDDAQCARREGHPMRHIYNVRRALRYRYVRGVTAESKMITTAGWDPGAA